MYLDFEEKYFHMWRICIGMYRFICKRMKTVRNIWSLKFSQIHFYLGKFQEYGQILLY